MIGLILQCCAKIKSFQPQAQQNKGSPIKNHRGRMEFSDEQGQTRLNYTIDFEPRLPFVLLGSILEKAIEKPIRDGLKRLAERYDT